MRAWRKALAVAAVAASAAVVAGSAPAQMPMLVDLANHRIHIDAAFTGAELLLFGALDRRGDVVVRVVGPPTDIAVRQKIQCRRHLAERRSRGRRHGAVVLFGRGIAPAGRHRLRRSAPGPGA